MEEVYFPGENRPANVADKVVRILTAGPLTTGVILNRFRKNNRDEVIAAVKGLLAEGTIKVENYTHAANGTTISKISLK